MTTRSLRTHREAPHCRTPPPGQGRRQGQCPARGGVRDEGRRASGDLSD